MRRSDACAGSVAALLLVPAAGEVARIAVQWPWRAFPGLASDAASALLAALWTATAVVLLLRRRSQSLARAAWVLSFLGPALMLGHGFVIGTTLSPLWLLYVPLALLLALLLRGVFSAAECRTLGDRQLRPAARVPA